MKVVFEKNIDPVYQKFVKNLFKSITYKNNFWVTVLDLIEINFEKFVVFKLSCSTRCSLTGDKIIVDASEKLLPVNVSESDHVMIVYKATKDFVLHEFTENFKYKKQPIYSEHAPVNKLYDMSKTASDLFYHLHQIEKCDNM